MNQRPKWTIEEVKTIVEKEGYRCISKVHINSKSKLKLECNKHHKFLIVWNSFLRGVRCSECAGNKPLTLKKIKAKVEIDGYRCVSKVYINSKTKLNFICPKGHSFLMIWNCFQQGHRCTNSECLKERLSGKNHHNWKGGISRKGPSVYNTYAHQLDWCEEVRRDPEHPRFLNVRCTETSCRKWFLPSTEDTKHRIKTLNGKQKGESRFYCSKKCKQTCSIYNQKLYPKGFKTRNGRDSEVQAELRDMVLKRDGYICLKCGSEEKLECHHIESLNCNPLMSADVDNCMTVCESCHDEIHKEEGCRYVDLRKDNLC